MYGLVNAIELLKYSTNFPTSVLFEKKTRNHKKFRFICENTEKSKNRYLWENHKTAFKHTVNGDIMKMIVNYKFVELTVQ